MKRHLFHLCLGAFCFLAAPRPALSQVAVARLPDMRATNSYYVGNRAPLAPSPFCKLPIGSITPRGWLRHQLELERDGMTGHLEEISPWLDFTKTSWADPEGRGNSGWEELPYWLKGFGDLGYVLKDETITAEARKWINAALAAQREDGWFGPRALLASLDGKPDLWPNMLMLNVFQSYYEATGDARALHLMSRYFKWENSLSVAAFGVGYWPKIRLGDNIESVFWLYNRAPEPWLLDLARKIHDGMARWDQDVINWHNVNLGQGFRAGTVFWMLSKNDRDLASAERNYDKVFDTFGQFPGGGFVGDENCRPGFTDPRGGIETCGIVELMHSFEMLAKITGQPVWADRCEEIAFNSFPAALTPDEKALHYITCANQIQLDRQNKAPGIQNSGTMFSYSPFDVYRCCQHNVSHGWPYYAEELWLATPDNGLAASLYAASDVSAQVGGGRAVKITEETDYPFGDVITLKIDAAGSESFPLYLRIPRWCARASLSVNGEPVETAPRPLAFVRLLRQWRGGDTVTLRLPMKMAVRRWPANGEAASVDYGPLSFSLAIKERFQKYGYRNPNWPEWEVFADSPWNYGLDLDPQNPAASFKVVKRAGPLAPQPFTPQTVPITLQARGRRIPNWMADRNNLVGKLQPSPVASSEPDEEITLIPMGAARLRVTMFPVIGSGPDAREWTAARRSPLNPLASYCDEGDTVDALDDGLDPSDSNDHAIPRFTWWDHRGTREWVQYDLPQAREVATVGVYWFDDSGQGQCRLPASWRLLYRDAGQWREVPAPVIEPVSRDKWNTISFPPVKTAALRLDVQLQPGYSGGILGWRVK